MAISNAEGFATVGGVGIKLGCRGNAGTGAEDAVLLIVVYERHQQDRNVKKNDRPGISLGAQEAIKITEKFPLH